MRYTIRLPAFGAAAIALVAAGLGGCSVTRTAFGPLQYDKASAAAPAIASTDVSAQPYPALTQVPPQPDDVRPIAAWNRDIFDMVAARRQLDAFQVANPQTFYGAEAFAQEAKIEAVPPPIPVGAQTPAGAAAAAAKDAKERATPPSPAR
ncbi:MAG TPA: hypothetical protein VGM25_14605 [Caulobacteraceae bacterium]